MHSKWLKMYSFTKCEEVATVKSFSQKNFDDKMLTKHHPRRTLYNFTLDIPAYTCLVLFFYTNCKKIVLY